MESSTYASTFQPYAIGHAASNLQVGQTTLQVVPIEKFGHIDGDVTDHVTELSASGTDSKGNTYSSKVNAGLAIEAKWLNRNPWLKMPGLIQRGEQVLIWRLGTTDQYFYELTGQTNNIRKKDIMLLVISNEPNNLVSEVTANNSVFFEINTVDKHITLSTPQNDGEPCGFLTQINFKEGMFVLQDTIGQAISLNAKEHLLDFVNADNTRVSLNKRTLDLYAMEKINIKTKVLNTEVTEYNAKGDKLSFSFSKSEHTGESLNFNYSNVVYKASSIKHNGKEIGKDHKHGGVYSGPSSTFIVS